MLDLILCADDMRDAAAQRADPAKPTRKKVYSVNILFHGSVWGVCICASPSQPAKSVMRELQTRFAGRRDAGSARVALTSLLTDKQHLTFLQELGALH